MAEVKKADLKSMDIPEDKLRQLKQVFPEVFTEGLKVDPDKLRLALGENVDAGRERFGMNWPGKTDCFKIIQAPSVATLVPARDESVSFDTTENLFIEGDNLEVLKLLQKSYYGKIKMIYIDPPYNTGKDFIYPDNYSESLDTYLRFTGQIDEQGRKYSSNSEADGRFHSKWLNMMYPRLYLAKNLLKDDGVIFVSIDENEVHHLRAMMDEIFGQENLVAEIVWKNRYNAAKEKHLAQIHEYVLFYAKSKELISDIYIPTNEEYVKRYFKCQDDKFTLRGPYRLQPLEAGKSMDERKNLMFDILAPDGSKIKPKRQWKWGEDRVLEAIKNREIEFAKTDDGWSVSTKQYLKDENGREYGIKPFTLIDGIYNQEGTKEIEQLFNSVTFFPFPKPTALIKHLVYISQAQKGDMILDFFSGSCTTAHAIIDLNKEENLGLSFICVQLPELTGIDSEAYSKGIKNIADIGKERIRRVIKRIQEESVQADKKEKSLFGYGKNTTIQDLGFKVFKLVQSNFKLWEGSVDPKKEVVEKQLEMHVDHINPKSSQEDILFELLLKAGFELTTKIEKVLMVGKAVYSIEGGLMLICLEKELTKEVIKAMAEKNPSRVICLDQGFDGNNQLKTNAVQIMKSKGVEDFRTV